VNAFQKLEDPPQGWPLSRLMDLIRYRFIQYFGHFLIERGE
jgi:hypothetical protein